MANTIVVKHRSSDATEPAGLLAGEIAANINAAGKKLFIGTGSGNIVFADQDYVTNGFQPLDTDLTAIAALANTDGNFIVGNGTSWVAESGATARTSLGLTIGTDVQAYSTRLDDFAALDPTNTGYSIRANGTDWVAVRNNISATAAPTANDDSGAGYVVGSVWLDVTNDKIYQAIDVTSTAAIWIDLSASDPTAIVDGDFASEGVMYRGATAGTYSVKVIGTDIQAYDPGLQSIAGLTTAADRMIYTTASDSYATTTLTATARTLLDDTTTTAMRTTLGLAIGSDVQAYDAGLADVAGLSTADGNFIVGNGTNWVAESGATARTSLGLGSLATLSSVAFSNMDGAAVVTAVETIDANSTSDVSFPTTKAVFDHVASALAGGVTYQGAYDASTNTPDLDTTPSGINQGDMYTVTVAGTFFTIDLEVGDVLISEVNNPTLESHWTIVQRNIINDQLIDGGTY